MKSQLRNRKRKIKPPKDEWEIIIHDNTTLKDVVEEFTIAILKWLKLHGDNRYINNNDNGNCNKQ